MCMVNPGGSSMRIHGGTCTRNLVYAKDTCMLGAHGKAACHNKENASLKNKIVVIFSPCRTVNYSGRHAMKTKKADEAKSNYA